MSKKCGEIRPGLYRHYKGPYYRVTGVATHSESEERLVTYQALYGDKGMWVRPLGMFSEKVVVDGNEVPRFAYIDPQTEVLEMAVLDVKENQADDFVAAFKQAQSIISSMQGYIHHSLSKCLERESRYLLLVNWQTLEDHTIGFRESSEYQKWKSLLHDFYDPFPSVEHFQALELT